MLAAAAIIRVNAVHAGIRRIRSRRVSFTVIPFGLTIEGQYIVKNLVIIACALIIGGHALRKHKAETESIAVP